MKKTTTSPDGTVEVVEGSAEEFADLENKTDKVNEKKKSKKRILLNEEDVKKIVNDALTNHIVTQPHLYPYIQVQPYIQPSYPGIQNPWLDTWYYTTGDVKVSLNEGVTPVERVVSSSPQSTNIYFKS